ncbi:MAG: hypothetical protein CTY12_07715 [Methylotenera sp.]|nr:MAG: hypothetical protein CTY12_07715 [Methylotenera sp.]
MMLKAKQKGFTLLELLVVITLLAISVGALVAYDRDKALFVGIVDPEGNGIDDNIAAAVSVDN